MFNLAASVVLIANSTYASPLFRRTELIYNPADPDRAFIADVDLSEPSPASEFNAYDNWSDGVELRGVRPQGDHEIGDDIYVIPLSGGHVSNVAWSIFNGSTNQEIRFITFTCRFYSLDGTLLGSHVRQGNFFNPLRPGTGALVANGGSGSMLPAGIIVPDNFYFTVTFSDAVDYDVSQAGVALVGPVLAGSSSRFYRDFTTGQNFDTGSPDINLAMFVRTDPIPAPATLLALPLLALLPRRRAR